MRTDLGGSTCIRRNELSHATIRQGTAVISGMELAVHRRQADDMTGRA